MPLWDRVLRALFVGLGVGLGWGIRGDFGHSLGAMAPGATLGMGFAYVTGQRSMFKWMPLLAAAGAFFISLGGMMSYGVLHGYAKSDTLVNYSYGFFCLVLQGGAWGGFGGAALGMLLERKRVKAGEWFGCIATAWLCGWLVYLLVVEWAGFHINPPRSDLSIGFTGAMMGIVAWLAARGKQYGLRGALCGYIGFGLGMALGRLFANASYLQPLAVNHWNIMEVSCGLIGGFVFTFGMLGPRFSEPQEAEGWGWVSGVGVVYVLALIPWLHRLRRIDPEEKLEEWAAAATQYGIENPEAFSRQVLGGLDLICVAAFLSAALWMLLWLKDKHWLAALPVVLFSLLMLLFQNTNALYFWYPAREHYINMHTVFWGLLGGMLLLAAYIETVGRTLTAIVADDALRPVAWGRWLAGSVAVYVLIVALAGIVNGEETMKSANMRFPIWSWRDGAPPPR